MIVDSSAIVAVAMGEPDAGRYAEALRSMPSSMSSATYLECAVVLDRRRRSMADPELDNLIRSTAIRVVPFTGEQARIARQAYRDFGKGSGHPAQLNFGDCFAYALAVDTGEALLYKGDDFAHTGVRSALANP